MKLCFALALFLLPAALAGSPGSLGVSSPLLLWSNRGVIGHGKHVSYQVLPNVEEVATELVLGALAKLERPALPAFTGFDGEALDVEEIRTVVVFIGSQLDAADMRSRTDAVHALDSVLTGAVSSLAMPYTTSQGASIREKVCSKLDDASIQHEVVGCSSPSTDIKTDVAAALAKGSNAQLHVVIACSHVENMQGNTNAGLVLEVEQLEAVRSAVEDAGVNHVFVYASQAQAESTITAANGRKRRTLLAYTGFGPYQTCGTLCQTQVRWLEGMLAMLVLALASCAGLVCLYVLDTPTRFESPKEVAPQQ